MSNVFHNKIAALPISVNGLSIASVKAFKTHRAAINFDAGFVNAGFVPALQGVIGNN